MEDQIVWQPKQSEQESTKLYQFIKNISNKYQVEFEDYHAFYQWTIDSPEKFWYEFLQYSGLKLQSNYESVLKKDKIFNKNRWFYNATCNFAENLLESRFIVERLKQQPHYACLVALDEQGNHLEYSISEIKTKVKILSDYFYLVGIKPGDRIAGLLPNIAESIIAMLATTAVGAVWTACSPDFGESGILERFKQIEPKIILVTDGYYYKNKYFDCTVKNNAVITELTNSLEIVITIAKHTQDSMTVNFKHCTSLQDIYDSSNVDKLSAIKYLPVNFNDPVYIMYSSGTTGQPKCIVHGVGGILLEHYKEHLLHNDLRFSDRLFYFTTTSWMMWHWQVSAIATGASIVIYDGAPNYPTDNSLIDLIDKYSISVFGASAKYFSSLEKNKLVPCHTNSLQSLRVLLSTGSPLVDEQYDYLYSKFKSEVALCSISGGTDIIGCFALGNPLLPVYKGQLQCRSLGINIKFFNDTGQEVIQEKAELVCLAPFPSMPIYFWNDPDGSKYHTAYFNKFDNIWAHGDYGMLTKQQGVVIYGRSDAVLNPGGVRIGTAEIYAELEKIPEVVEAIACGQNYHNDERIILFVVMQKNIELDHQLSEKIKKQIKKGASPRHVPALIIQVPDLPRTTSGKLVELAVKNIISGQKVKNINALANPESLNYFTKIPELL